MNVLAPDVRELKVKMGALSKRVGDVDKRLSEQIETLERWMSEKSEASSARTDAQFHAILAAIAQSKAENEPIVVKETRR